MKEKELIHVIFAIIILAIIISVNKIILESNYLYFGTAILFAFIIITTNILGKKVVAGWLDASIEHKVWFWQRYWFKYHWKLKKPAPIGAILPLIISAFSLGFIKLMTILTYETSALKRRAAKRFGYYSFTEMTDFHISLIGAAGIFTTLVLAFIAYWIPPLEELSRMAAFYAFWNLLPISKLDGSQIFFGSRVIWTTLMAIALIFSAFAILLAVY